jgi:DNA repair exonuclease SbcCD nuclease subunit
MIEKSIIISDLHANRFNSSLEKFSVTENFLSDFLVRNIKEKQPDNLIFLGDLFDDKSVLNTYLHSKVLSIFKTKLSPLVKSIFIITGNHDTFKKEDLENSSIYSFGLIHNCEVIKNYKDFNTVNGKIRLIAWQSNKEKLEKILIEAKESNISEIYGHNDIFGMKYDNGKDIGEEGLNISFLSTFRYWCFGHVHKRQQKNNGEFLGTPYQTRSVEYKNQNGIGFRDFTKENIKTEFIENNESPKYKRFFATDILNMKLSEVKKHFNDSYVMILMDSYYQTVLNFNQILNHINNHRSFEIKTIPIKNNTDNNVNEKDDLDFSGDFELNFENTISEYLNSLEDGIIIQKQKIFLSEQQKEYTKNFLLKLKRKLENENTEN